METTLYGDQDYSVYRLPQMDNVQQLKKRMTLDLGDSRPGKRQRTDPLLTSPDVNMLKLASPELERFITQHGLATTPTPGNAINTVFSSIGRPPTEEEENYARGFVDALHHLKQQEQQLDCAVSAAAQYGHDASPVYTTLESSQAAGCGGGGMPTMAGTAPCSLPGAMPGHGQYYGLPAGVHIKEEPQTVPSVSSHASSPQPPSPVDMAEQERIKLERKRLRNRIAATKCRKRKLERIARLEERVRQIKSENSELAAVAGRLREQVMALKKEVQQHTQNGCQILQPH